MSKLSDVASVARKVIKFGGIALVFLMVGRVILVASLAYWKALHPDPPPPPDVKFGKLPKLLFPQKDVPKFTYKLETRTGSLPTALPDQYKVFFMPIKKPSLLAYSVAKDLGAKLDFITEPTKLSETDYRWDMSSSIDSSLTMNIITGAFILDRKWQQDQSFETATLYLDENQAVDQVYNFLSRIELLSQDLQKGTHNIQPLKADSGELTSAPSLSKAQFLRVNLFRAPVADTKVVSPSPDKGLISAVLAFQREDARQFVRVDYNYFPVDLEQFASYPLITPTEAWNRMQNGGGYVAAYRQGADSVTVRDVNMAYYDSDIPQQFLQPVYLFEGDEGFVGYVPAVSDKWVE
ncbi:MAG: hypothetical protein WCL07_04090 [bacterium]